jgi:hypothetical protein
VPEDVESLARWHNENTQRWGQARAEALLRERIDEVAEIIPLASIEAEVERVKAAARLTA